MKPLRIMAVTIPLLPSVAAAQAATPVAVGETSIGAGFFGALLAGILMAMGFQLLLTALSVGAGISAVGDLEEPRSAERSPQDGKAKRGGTPLPIRITHAMGVWGAVTTSIAVFCAVWIAVNAVFLSTPMVAIACGLAIWAAFLLALTYLEGRVWSTAAGTMIRAALSGLQGVSSTVGEVFSRSRRKAQEETLEHAIDHAVDRVRDEVSARFDTDVLEEKLDRYVQDLRPPRLDPEELRAEMASLLDDIEVVDETEVEDGEAKRRMILEVASRRSDLSEEDRTSLRRALRDSRTAYGDGRAILRSDERPADKGMRLADRFSPGSEEDARETRLRIERYLTETGRDELHPDGIRDDIDRMVADPDVSGEVMRRRLSMIDRETIKAALQTRTDLDEKRAEQVVQAAERALDFVRDESARAPGRVRDARDRATAAGVEGRQRAEAEGRRRLEEGRAGMKLRGRRAEEEIARRIDALRRPELNYRALKRDVKRIMDDPRQAPEVIQARLERFDRETAMAVIAAAPNVSPEQAERLVKAVEQARDETRVKVDQVRTETERRVRSAREEATHQAEVARKTASRAAWWLTATAFLSGSSAAVAGLLAAA